MLILMECVLNLVALDLFLVVDRLLQAYQLFLIAHQQVSGRNLTSKISLSVLLSDGQNLSWLSRFSLFEVLGYMGYCFLIVFFLLLFCYCFSCIFRYPEMKFFLSIFHIQIQLMGVVYLTCLKNFLDLFYCLSI